MLQVPTSGFGSTRLKSILLIKSVSKDQVIFQGRGYIGACANGVPTHWPKRVKPEEIVRYFLKDNGEVVQPDAKFLVRPIGASLAFIMVVEVQNRIKKNTVASLRAGRGNR